MITTSTIINELPPELVWRIDKLLHKQYQYPINEEIKETVERIEDAMDINNLYYYHLHNIRNCKHLPFLLPGSFKRVTYHWIYETPEDCIEYDDDTYTINYMCNKRKLDISRDMFYNNGSKYRSEPVTGIISKTYKLRKLE